MSHDIVESNRVSFYKEFNTPSMDEPSYIELTEWANGEGVDIEVEAPHNLSKRTISLTENELVALKEILSYMECRNDNLCKQKG